MATAAAVAKAKAITTTARGHNYNPSTHSYKATSLGYILPWPSIAKIHIHK